MAGAWSDLGPQYRDVRCRHSVDHRGAVELGPFGSSAVVQSAPCRPEHLTASADLDAYQSHLTFTVVVSISPSFGFSLCLAELAAGQPQSRHRRIRISTHAIVAWGQTHSALSIGGTYGHRHSHIFHCIRNFGFIGPEDGSKDVFVHAIAMEQVGAPSLGEGDKVQYEVKLDSWSGTSFACDLKKL